MQTVFAEIELRKDGKTERQTDTCRIIVDPYDSVAHHVAPMFYSIKFGWLVNKLTTDFDKSEVIMILGC